MNHSTTPEIFISYSWKNTNTADEIDNSFKSIGITMRRDIRDAAYRASIKEFMQQISKTDFVLMIISDEYLKSENCMYEVIELLNTHDFEKRILPIVLDNAQAIFKGHSRVIYYEYWQKELKEAEKRKKKFPNADTINEVKRYNSINANLDIFFEKITDFNVLSYARLQQENYRPILKVIGIDDNKLLTELLQIDSLEDDGDKEVAIEEFLLNHPNNIGGLFYKAYLANALKHYKKSKLYYTHVLQIGPQYASAHNNLANLLNDQFKEYEEAKKHYEQTLTINPQYVDAHDNLAILLNDQFKEYEEAKKHYEQAITINPQYAKAHYNLAILLVKHFKECEEEAFEHYQQAIAIDPSLEIKLP